MYPRGLHGFKGTTLRYISNSILSYTQYFILGTTRPHKILNYISTISVRYDTACFELYHMSIFH